jgi:hypothetical protein
LADRLHRYPLTRRTLHLPGTVPVPFGLRFCGGTEGIFAMACHLEIGLPNGCAVEQLQGASVPFGLKSRDGKMPENKTCPGARSVL